MKENGRYFMLPNLIPKLMFPEEKDEIKFDLLTQKLKYPYSYLSPSKDLQPGYRDELQKETVDHPLTHEKCVIQATELSAEQQQAMQNLNIGNTFISKPRILNKRLAVGSTIYTLITTVDCAQ
ncbi:unnamed protein product [Allacma fusca]|uniref:Uncharacterized protein n=1 Tax=Allacma fusca TaxID=39272 RepID=A0A8J2KIN4_9HEXA|nr:unnamed protein product [Allacma fusca]